MANGTLLENLGIEFTEIGADFLKAQMPVDQRTIQPFKILHGGASVALAETVGSVGSFMIIDPEKYISVGLEINANHIKAAKNGYVTAIGKPIHIGKKTHVWDIKINNELNQLVCISRMTVAIISNKK